MSDDDMDRRLRGLLDSMTPAQLDRLKILVNARTVTPPGPPTDGPATYRGIPVTESLHHNWDQHEASWWRAGVNATLAVAVPLVESLRYDGECSLDHHGYCQEHGLPGGGPLPRRRGPEVHHGCRGR
jgi:hypothetical protein